METVQYGFLLPNGNLAKLECEFNGEDRYACGKYRYWLSETGNNDFLVDSVTELETILCENTRWYNTSATQPGWGDFKKTDLTPCKVVITKSPIKIAPKFIIHPLQLRSWPSLFVKKVYPQCDESKKYFWILCYQDKNDLINNIGKYVYINDTYITHTLHTIIDVPDEYDIPYNIKIDKEKVTVKPTCVAITSYYK